MSNVRCSSRWPEMAKRLRLKLLVRGYGPRRTHVKKSPFIEAQIVAIMKDDVRRVGAQAPSLPRLHAEGAGTDPRRCAVVNRKRSGAIADVLARGFFRKR
jgi:hypothetical protein